MQLTKYQIKIHNWDVLKHWHQNCTIAQCLKFVALHFNCHHKCRHNGPANTCAGMRVHKHPHPHPMAKCYSEQDSLLGAYLCLPCEWTAEPLILQWIRPSSWFYFTTGLAEERGRIINPTATSSSLHPVTTRIIISQTFLTSDPSLTKPQSGPYLRSRDEMPSHSNQL